MHRRLRIVAVVLIASLPALVIAQSTQPAAPPGPAPTRPGKVLLTGENPGIRLLDKPNGATMTQVSYWRVHWSPVGPGHVCFVTVGDQKTPGSQRIALFDNEKLFNYLAKDVLGTFNKSFAEWPFTPVGGASFTAGGNSITERRETCKADKYSIELVWRDLREPALVDIMTGSRPPNPFGLVFVRIPAGSAAVTINGKPAPGTSFPDVAFLAFGETWIK